ncbi:prohormone-2 [Tribolium castaneum]|uniref:prohormone-2 n=1 Tax=Tribolium castaneum TaxID=7070 RepID=UPI0030FE38BB
MELRWSIRWATLASCLALSFAIPASLVEEIKTNELRNNKVKRAHPQLNVGEHGREVPYYSKPTAIKRGANNLKNPSPEQQSLSDWEQEQSLYQNPDSLADIQSSLYNAENPFDDKTIAEYEKGFHYGTNKEKLDEALENAVLKSELYGDPAPLNQYRYYGNDDQRRRKRRDARKIRLDSRMKREVDLTPDEILTILTLYENERNGYRPWGLEPEPSGDNLEEEENWLDAPVYPHATGHNDLAPSYLMDEKRGRWGGFADSRKKRFMVAKKRNDPTRELRYLNGPNKNDYYTLSQLLSNQREPNVPLYHRLVL